jgi:predicted membrane-bound spermidine synthase
VLQITLLARYSVAVNISQKTGHYGIVLLFFVSGAAALIYQVCWQRMLFESIGVDMDSVTIIVSTFMLGLGVGSLLGGELADRYPARTLEMFALAELATALFGFCSPPLIRSVAGFAVQQSAATIATINFTLLLIPTTLMGATLPILVTRTVRLYRNLGSRWACCTAPTRWVRRSARPSPEWSYSITWAWPRPWTSPRSSISRWPRLP